MHGSTQMADVVYRTAKNLFEPVGDQGPFRLIGCGLSHLIDADGAELAPDLLDPDAGKRSAAERATDKIRERFGPDAIKKGRSLR